MDRRQLITDIIKNYEEQIKILKKELGENEVEMILTISGVELVFDYDNASAYSECTFSGFYLNDERKELLNILFANKKTGTVYDYIYGPSKWNMDTSYDLCRIITHMYSKVTDTDEKTRLMLIYNKIIAKNEVLIRFRDNDELTVDDLEELLTVIKPGYGLDKMIGTIEALKYVVLIGSSIAATKDIRKARIDDFNKTRYICLMDINHKQ